MKKALVVFLILAVAGGLFATPTFSGSVETGIGIGFDNTEGDNANKALVGWIMNRGEHGLLADLNVSGSGGGKDADGNPNPYGSWGASMGVRGRADNRLNTGAGYTIMINGGTVWWQPNDYVYLAIGTGGNKDYGTPGGLGQKNGVHDADGLKIALTPISGLSIGVNAFYNNAKKNLEDMNIGFGVNYTMPSLLNVVANIRYKPEETATKPKDNAFDAAAGANFLGLSAVGLTKLAADVSTYNWGAKFQSIGVGEAITFKALENLLTLDLSGQQYFYMGDENYDFIPMRYRAGVSYTIDKIVPAIQFQYTMGNSPAFNYRNSTEVGGVVVTPDANGKTSFKDGKDLVALGISPQVTFNFGPTLTIGWNIQMDMSKDAKATATTPTMQHLIYGTVKINF